MDTVWWSCMWAHTLLSLHTTVETVPSSPASLHLPFLHLTLGRSRWNKPHLCKSGRMTGLCAQSSDMTAFMQTHTHMRTQYYCGMWVHTLSLSQSEGSTRFFFTQTNGCTGTLELHWKSRVQSCAFMCVVWLWPQTHASVQVSLHASGSVSMLPRISP